MVKPRGGHGLQHLFDHWDEVSRRIRAAREILLFLDFDGTLVDFRSLPHQVSLGRETRLALRRLLRHRRLHLAIVSGRRRETLVQLVKIPRAKYMGLYGWEDAAGLHLPKRTALMLAELRTSLARLPSELPGIYVEDKGFSLSVHFRGAPPVSRRRARARMRRLVARFHPDLHVIRANNTWEAVPRQVRGKGVAMQEAVQGVKTTSLVFYAGDDLTDEPAFAA